MLCYSSNMTQLWTQAHPSHEFLALETYARMHKLMSHQLSRECPCRRNLCQSLHARSVCLVSGLMGWTGAMGFVHLSTCRIANECAIPGRVVRKRKGSLHRKAAPVSQQLDQLEVGIFAPQPK